MANFLTYFKKNNSNIYSLIISVLLCLWYNGISGLINFYAPIRGLELSLVLLIIPLVIFLSDDGHLDELYKPADTQYPIISAAQSSAQMKREKFVK